MISGRMFREKARFFAQPVCAVISRIALSYGLGMKKVLAQFAEKPNHPA